MQERLSLLLKLTAFFVLHFWVMIVSHYSLRGNLLGLPTTAIVGSSAIVLLAFLIVKVRQPISHLPVESSSPRNARFALVFLIVGFLFTGLLLPVSGTVTLGVLVMLGLCLWIYIGLISLLLGLISLILLPIQLLISGSPISTAPEAKGLPQLHLTVGTLIGLVVICIAIVQFFNIFFFLINQAALPKRIEWVASTLQAIGLVLVLSFFLGKLQYIMPGERLLCSTSYPSPSGQRSLVIEDYEEFEGDRYYSHAYLNGLIFRRDLGDFPNRYGSNKYGCTQGKLTFNWSDDERQVDWEKLRP